MHFGAEPSIAFVVARCCDNVMRIAILEDDISQAKLISLWLEIAGHACHHFQTAAAFQKNLVHESYDLLILDWELPTSSGLDVLVWVRQQKGWDLPVLFTTVRDSEADIVAALLYGKPLDKVMSLLVIVKFLP